LRVGAVAHEPGVHSLTAGRWVKAGRMQVVQVGRGMRIAQADIERMVGSNDGQLPARSG
jgi:excisionase family DNA binding protein